jgi:phosphoheptose isomerase
MTEEIQQHILENIQSLSSIPEDTFENVVTATAVLSLCFPENKIIIAGTALSNPIGSIFSQQLNLAFALSAQPSLNSYCLCSDTHRINSLYPNLGINETLKLEFSLIFKPGDTLLLISDNPEDSNIFSELIAKAHEVNCNIVIFTRNDDLNFNSLLNEEDILIDLPAENSACFLEMSLILLNSINNCLINTINDF